MNIAHIIKPNVLFTLRKASQYTSLLHFDLYLVGQRSVTDRRVGEHLESVRAIGEQVGYRRQHAAFNVVHRPQRYRQIGLQRVVDFVALPETCRRSSYSVLGQTANNCI